MAGYKDTYNIAKKAADVAQKKSNNWSMASFIHNWVLKWDNNLDGA